MANEKIKIFEKPSEIIIIILKTMTLIIGIIVSSPIFFIELGTFKQLIINRRQQLDAL